MLDALIAWDSEDDPDGNVRHIADNDVTPEEVEEVLRHWGSLAHRSRSSGRPLTIGRTRAGRRIGVIWEKVSIKPPVVRPVTAFELE